MKQELIDIKCYDGDGYKPLIDFGFWRVAVLKYCEELEIQNIKTMQKHNKTDEVFILLDGNCMLFTGGKGDTIDEIDAVRMEPFKLYNVKSGVWHTHTLDKKGTVAIVENRNTTDDNSPSLLLSQEQRDKLYRKFVL